MLLGGVAEPRPSSGVALGLSERGVVGLSERGVIGLSVAGSTDGGV